MTEVRYIKGAGDIARMMEIERSSFASPWDESDVLRELASDGRTRFLGVYADGLLAGWGCFSLYFTVSHLMTLAVHPDFRRNGLATSLLKGILQAAADAGARYMQLECRAGNTAAQALYRSLGFKRAGVSTAYYPDTGEDALIYIHPRLPEGNSENDPYLIQE